MKQVGLDITAFDDSFLQGYPHLAKASESGAEMIAPYGEVDGPSFMAGSPKR